MQISHYMLLSLVSEFFLILFTLFSSSHQAHKAVIPEQEYLTKMYFHRHTKRPNNVQKFCKTLKMLKQTTDNNETLKLTKAPATVILPFYRKKIFRKHS